MRVVALDAGAIGGIAAADPNGSTFWGMPLWLAVAAAVLIIFVRGQAYYWIGRGLGTKVYASRLGRRIGTERIQKVERMVRTRGALAVLGSHWVAGLRHAIPICAGIVHMSYAWFLLATALGALLWTPPWVVGGYAIVWGWLRVAAGSPITAVTVPIGIVLLVAVFGMVRRRRRRGSPDPEAPPESDERSPAAPPG